MTRSQSTRSSKLVVVAMRAMAALRSASLSRPLATSRAMAPSTVARPAWSRSWDTSLIRTSNPAKAQTWAMPLPICPAPITPTF